MFHCEGGWNDVLDDMKTLFVLETVMLASFRVSGKNVMVPSFGNLAFHEVCPWRPSCSVVDVDYIEGCSFQMETVLPSSARVSKFVRGRGG